METAAAEFDRIVSAIVTHFFAQAGRPVPAGELPRLAAQLRQQVNERGLPPPLRAGDPGVPGGMSEQDYAPLVGRVAAGLGDPLFADVAKQLVKACFYPEFTQCRDSFREVSRDGSCRRQELERARGRISGVHCVDCPHWVALPPDRHSEFLRAEWRGDPALLAAHGDVFLPEDFRALRLWLHAAARR